MGITNFFSNNTEGITGGFPYTSPNYRCTCKLSYQQDNTLAREKSGVALLIFAIHHAIISASTCTTVGLRCHEAAITLHLGVTLAYSF